MRGIAEAYRHIIDKVTCVADRTPPTLFPYSAENGRFTNCHDQTLHDWWTDGFWPGILWKLYAATGEAQFRAKAEMLEEQLDSVIANYVTLHHDVGFMWLLSSGANYRLTGNETARKRILHMAGILAGRFNIQGRFIRAWNDENREGWAIIDCMMNLPLLYYASEETGDPRFRHIARSHADTVLQYGLRDNGSVSHIIAFDPESGSFMQSYAGQGYSSTSSWARGQAWGLYGFALSYRHTREQAYLDASMRIADYFLSALDTSMVPPCDFQSPSEPVYFDASAGAIAANGLLELAQWADEPERYRRKAIALLQALEQRCCSWDFNEDYILGMSTEAYHTGGKNIPLIYGDYFFIEAVFRLMGDKSFFW